MKRALAGHFVAALALLGNTLPAQREAVARAEALLADGPARLQGRDGAIVAELAAAVGTLHDAAATEPLVRTLLLQSRALRTRGWLAQAIAAAERAVGLAERNGLTPLLAAGHLEIALCRAAVGTHVAAAQHVREAERLFDGARTPRQAAELRYVTAHCARLRGDAPYSIEHLYAALDLAVANDLIDVAARVHLELAEMGLLQHNHLDAQRSLARCVALCERHDLDLLRVDAGFFAALLAMNGGQSPAAVRTAFTAAIAQAERCGGATRGEIARGRGMLARWVEQDLAGALSHFAAAAHDYADAGALGAQAMVAGWLADTHRLLDHHEVALQVLEEHEPAFTAVDQPRLRVSWDRVRAQSLAALGRFEQAYQPAWLAADTERWLGGNEATAELTRVELSRQLERREQDARMHLLVAAAISGVTATASVFLWWLYRALRRAHRRQLALNQELQDALSHVRELRGLLPICAQCKSIRDDEGYWHRIESYLVRHSNASFSHGICPSCANSLYPELFPGQSGDAPPAE